MRFSFPRRQDYFARSDAMFCVWVKSLGRNRPQSPAPHQSLKHHKCVPRASQMPKERRRSCGLARLRMLGRYPARSCYTKRYLNSGQVPHDIRKGGPLSCGPPDFSNSRTGCARLSGHSKPRGA